MAFFITAKGHDVFVPKTLIQTRLLKSWAFFKNATLSECAARCLSEDDQRVRSGFVELLFEYLDIIYMRNNKENCSEIF